MPSPKSLYKIQHDDPIVNRIQDQLIAAVNPLLKGSAQKPSWQMVGPAAPFQNSWANLDGGIVADANHRSASFVKDAFGWVQLRGVVTGGVAGSVICQLPVGYRPLFLQTFPADCGGSYGAIQVATNGNVRNSSGAVTWNYLDSIRFLAEG